MDSFQIAGCRCTRSALRSALRLIADAFTEERIQLGSRLARRLLLDERRDKRCYSTRPSTICLVLSPPAPHCQSRNRRVARN